MAMTKPGDIIGSMLSGFATGDPNSFFKQQHVQNQFLLQLQKMKMEEEGAKLHHGLLKAQTDNLLHEMKMKDAEREWQSGSTDIQPPDIEADIPEQRTSPTMEGTPVTETELTPENTPKTFRGMITPPKVSVSNRLLSGEAGKKIMLESQLPWLKEKKDSEKPVVVPQGGTLFSPTGKVLGKGEPKDSSWKPQSKQEAMDVRAAGRQASPVRLQDIREDKGSKYRLGVFNPENGQRQWGEWVDKEETPASKKSDEKLNKQLTITLRKEFNSLQPIKDFRDVETKYSLMKKALEESNKTDNFVATDQALITLFNKMTDPQSVVRESEYIRTPENISMWSRLKGKVAKFIAGGAGLTPEDRNALVRMGSLFYDTYKSKYNQYANEYREYAKGLEIDPNQVVKSGDKEVIKTGTDTTNGKRVIQYSDGSIEYEQ